MSWTLRPRSPPIDPTRHLEVTTLHISSSVRAAASYRPPRGIVAGLFDGIALSADQQKLAQQIVADSIDAQLSVTLRNTDGWARLFELQTARDTALRALLTTDGDREIFDRHSAEV